MWKPAWYCNPSLRNLWAEITSAQVTLGQVITQPNQGWPRDWLGSGHDSIWFKAKLLPREAF